MPARSATLVMSSPVVTTYSTPSVLTAATSHGALGLVVQHAGQVAGHQRHVDIALSSAAGRSRPPRRTWSLHNRGGPRPCRRSSISSTRPMVVGPFRLAMRKRRALGRRRACALGRGAACGGRGRNSGRTGDGRRRRSGRTAAPGQKAGAHVPAPAAGRMHFFHVFHNSLFRLPDLRGHSRAHKFIQRACGTVPYSTIIEQGITVAARRQHR